MEKVDKVWLKHNETGETKEVEATAETLTPLMIAGWSQCDPPVKPEVKHHEQS